MSNVVMFSAYRTSERDKMLHEMAAPFFDLAERLDDARENAPDKDSWKATLETNNFIWRATADYLPRNFDRNVPDETAEMLKNVAEFMPRASKVVLKQPESEVCAQMATLNRNMYNQILTMRAGA